MPEITVDVDALYGALDAKRDSDELTWRDLARDLRISPSTFTRMAMGRRPDIDTFATLLGWLERPAEDFTRTRARNDAAAAAVAMVSLHFKAARNVRDADVTAYEDIVGAAMRRLQRLG